MEANKSIACDLYDYLEIACMYRYQVRVTLKSGEVLVGVPKTTVIEDKKELLLLECESNQPQKIATLNLKTMEVLTANAKFTRIEF
ncbi:Rho-binding antiterminator [Paraglaciecola arctica]|uniref:Rho-binding antiterminator n=1 Tax=Paraglaciecola arctica TaxID=1128911 RepID=UPI001C06DCF4|nr:Rho-binding antiterminator [Paraglaciecola arctica]MBU3003349.1 Rho-binding antiterminator [Paraglaciecola arctica]